MRYPVWKPEECSSLVPSRCIFYKTQWAWQGVKLTRFNVNFHIQKSLQIFDKKAADKIWSKKDKEWKVSSLMPIRVNRNKSQIYFFSLTEYDCLKTATCTRSRNPYKEELTEKRNMEMLQLCLIFAFVSIVSCITTDTEPIGK